jgi:UDP-3-O-acyl N-acetylglucosamine deacetylase
MKQITLKIPVVISGPGLHKGRKNTLTIKPAKAGCGIIIRNCGVEYKLAPELVHDTNRGTTIRYKNSTIHTVEHLVSALRGLSIDNVILEIDGDEPPAVDGSSFPYVKAVKKAGLITLQKEKEVIKINEPVMLEDNDSYMAILPNKGFKVTYFADFSKYQVPPSDVSVDITPVSYEKSVSKARTFGFKSEIGWLLKAGLIKGASLDNAILMDNGKPVQGSLRYKDELTRHKILDIIGDFGMLGANFDMHIIAVKTGHKNNVEMARRIEKIV